MSAFIQKASSYCPESFNGLIEREDGRFTTRFWGDQQNRVPTQIDVLDVEHNLRSVLDPRSKPSKLADLHRYARQLHQARSGISLDLRNTSSGTINSRNLCTINSLLKEVDHKLGEVWYKIAESDDLNRKAYTQIKRNEALMSNGELKEENRLESIRKGEAELALIVSENVATDNVNHTDDSLEGPPRTARQSLIDNGYYLVPVEGDGNCTFRAIGEIVNRGYKDVKYDLMKHLRYGPKCDFYMELFSELRFSMSEAINYLATSSPPYHTPIGDVINGIALSCASEIYNISIYLVTQRTTNAIDVPEYSIERYDPDGERSSLVWTTDNGWAKDTRLLINALEKETNGELPGSILLRSDDSGCPEGRINHYEVYNKNDDDENLYD